MTTYLRFFNYDEAFEYYCGLIDKMLQGTNRNNHARIIAKPALILSIIKLIKTESRTTSSLMKRLHLYTKVFSGSIF